MANNVNKFSRVDTILASAVADAGTFVVAYPSGKSQLSFNVGLAGSAHYMIVNNNDKWAAADSDMSVAFGASDITVTNSSGVTLAAGSTVSLFFDERDGNEIIFLDFPINLASIAGAGDVVTGFRPGVHGVIEAVSWVQNIAVTTGGDAADLNLEIGTTNVTGGVVSLTSATATPIGKVIEGTAITANNVLTPESLLSVEAANVTAFAEGSGTLKVRVRLTRSDNY